MLLQCRNAAKRTACMHMWEKSNDIPESRFVLAVACWTHGNLPKRQSYPCRCGARENQQMCETVRARGTSKHIGTPNKNSCLTIRCIRFPCLTGFLQKSYTCLHNRCNGLIFELALALDQCGVVDSNPGQQIHVSTIESHKTSA